MRPSLLALPLLLSPVPALAAPSLLDADLAVAAAAELRALEPGLVSDLLPGRVLGWAGGRFVRLEQRVGGLPVRGATLTAAFDPAGRLAALRGEPLLAPPLSLVLDLPESEAVALAEAWTDFEEGASGRLWDSWSEPVLVLREGVAQLAHEVHVSTREPLGAHRVWVDAHGGSILGSTPELFTARATVYPTNPVTSELTEVELNDVDGELRNGYAFVRSCTDYDEDRGQCRAKTIQAEPDEAGDFHFEPAAFAELDPFAEVQMFFHLDLVTRWFEDQFGFRTDFGFAGSAVEGIVNFPLANAFYGDADGDGVPEVAFGQGDAADFAYDADVVYHEFGHAVFGQIVDTETGRYDEYGRLPSSGGLNEGTADVFSLVLTGDPRVGDYAGSGFAASGAIRDLEADRTCPEDLVGESHADGEIWGSTAWNMIEDPALGAELTAHLYFGAIAMLEGSVDWQKAGLALLDSADLMHGAGALSTEQVARIGEIVRASGMPDCGRVLRLDDGATPTQGISGRARPGREYPPRPLINQFSLDAPEGTTALRFVVDELVTDDEGLAWILYVRRGEHVVHTLEEVQFGNRTVELGVPTIFDHSVQGEGDGFVLTLDADSEPALEPGATYYFSIASTMTVEDGRANGEITVRGEKDFAPDGADPSDDGDGCSSCSVAASRAPGAGLLALLLLPAALRRRR